MIYWNTTPGAAYDIAIPNNIGITPAEVEEMELVIVIQNNVGRWDVDGTGWIIDEVTPGYLLLHLTNSDDPWEFPPDGEYTYWAYLFNEHTELLLSQGLMIFGDYEADRIEYEQTTEYEQYD